MVYLNRYACRSMVIICLFGILAAGCQKDAEMTKSEADQLKAGPSPATADFNKKMLEGAAKSGHGPAAPGQPASGQ